MMGRLWILRLIHVIDGISSTFSLVHGLPYHYMPRIGELSEYLMGL